MYDTYTELQGSDCGDCYDQLWDYCLENDLIMLGHLPITEWRLWYTRVSRISAHVPPTHRSNSGSSNYRGSNSSGGWKSWSMSVYYVSGP